MNRASVGLRGRRRVQQLTISGLASAWLALTPATAQGQTTDGCGMERAVTDVNLQFHQAPQLLSTNAATVALHITQKHPNISGAAITYGGEQLRAGVGEGVTEGRRVSAWLLIDRQGRVGGIKSASGSDDDAVWCQAIDILSMTRWTPALGSTGPVPSWVLVHVRVHSARQ